jgi:hypothetical protein
VLESHKDPSGTGTSTIVKWYDPESRAAYTGPPRPTSPGIPPALTVLEVQIERAKNMQEALNQTTLHSKQSVMREELLRSLTTISDAAQTMAQNLAIHAVQKNQLSRVQAGKILGVHQGTVARWLKEAAQDNSGMPPL